MSKLETFVPEAGVGKSKSKFGSLWDRIRHKRTEPPYRPLPDYHIRVLRIKPGTVQYPLRVKLMVVDPRSLKYIALSYVWETSDDETYRGETQTILCGGLPVTINQNLYAALSQIRDVQSNVPVFVDALCIDFRNLAERTNYLEIMGHIYNRAASVIVYLGPKTKYTDETVLIMRKLVNAIDWRKIESQNSYDFQDPAIFIALGLDTAPTLREWRQIAAFCHLRWFSRRWTFFELCLAKETLFLWGECCMEYKFLIDFGMILRLSGWLEQLQGAPLETNNSGFISLTKMLGPVGMLRNVPLWHPKHKNHERWMVEEFGLHTDQQRAWKFFETLLITSAPFQCSDDRDLVYSALAYARVAYAGKDMNKQWPRPDYGMPAQEVLARYSHLIQQHTGESSVLTSYVVQAVTQSAPGMEQRGRASRRRLLTG